MRHSIAKFLTQGTESLTTHGISTPRLDAEVLLAHTLGLTRTALLARLRDALSEEDNACFQQLIHRRSQREPLQYITSVQEFWSLEFRVTPDVLIPRPETELVVETALQLLSQHATRNTQHPPLRILDVGTGSGCIAIALAKELPNAELWATDISSAALAIAQENAQRHGVAERIHFLCGDLFTPLQNLNLTFDLIVSNPPYIAQNDLPGLQVEVKDWEPQHALDGGIDGLDFYRRLVQESPRFLRQNGWLIMEIGYDQGQTVLQLAQQQSALTNVTCLNDLEGRARVVLAQKKPEGLS